MKVPLISLLAALGSAIAAQVNILGINDMHANIDDLPRLATFLKAERSADPDVLLYMEGKENVDYSTASNIDVSIE